MTGSRDSNDLTNLFSDWPRYSMPLTPLESDPPALINVIFIWPTAPFIDSAASPPSASAASDQCVSGDH